MPLSPRMLKAGALLMSGAALGAGGGYAASASGSSGASGGSGGSGASGASGASGGSSGSGGSAASGAGGGSIDSLATRAARNTKAHRSGAHGARAGLRRAVSITAVVPDGAGRFATVSIQRGTLVSTAADQLTLREGTAKATYKTLTISLPAGTVVRLSHRPSSLAGLAAGDRVAVVQGPRRTAVIARTPKSGSAGAATTPGG